MSKSNSDSIVHDLDAFDAKEALDTGNVAVLGAYLAELQENLRLISDLLDPKDDQVPRLMFSIADRECADISRETAGAQSEQDHGTRPSMPDSAREDGTSNPGQEPSEYLLEDDWTGSTSQLREAILRQAASPIGQYLRDAAGLLKHLGAVIDTDLNGEEPWHLSFRRRSPGKPSNPQEVMLRKDHIAMLVRFEKARLGGKLEAAVHSIMQEYGLGRSTVMEAWQSHKKQE